MIGSFFVHIFEAPSVSALKYSRQVTDPLIPLENRPNFFIVGAPKCGTTSLYETLRQHPDVFMPYRKEQFWKYKEPYFFCDELIAWPGLRIQDEATYLSLFQEAEDIKRRGEATTLYLYSQKAPQRIKNFSPDAKIIILLRQPVDMMISWHHDCLRWGHENVSDFVKALALENERKIGKQLPKGSGYPKCLLYRDIATFSPQIERFFNVFGRSQVGVWLLDDVNETPQKTLNEITDFLEIDPMLAPTIRVHNKRRSLTQADQVKNHMKAFVRYNVPWMTRLKPYVPSGIKKVFFKGLKSMNGKIIKEEMDLDLIARLDQSFMLEIERLEGLLGRDLSRWKKREQTALTFASA